MLWWTDDMNLSVDAYIKLKYYSYQSVWVRYNNHPQPTTNHDIVHGAVHDRLKLSALPSRERSYIMTLKERSKNQRIIHLQEAMCYRHHQTVLCFKKTVRNESVQFKYPK